MAYRPRQELFDRSQIEELQIFTALDHLLQPLEANGRSKIKESARQRSDGYSVPQRPVLGSEGASFVKSKRRSRAAVDRNAYRSR